jgi:molecular chaperone DnaK (HSP70)
MEYTIAGIDFGTSTTVVKVKNYFEGMNPKDCQFVMFGTSPYLPTLVFEDADSRLYIGYEAETQVKSGAAGVLHENFKMDLIGDSEQRATALRLTKEFFKYIYSEFDRQRHTLNVRPVVKTYVSYPAKWTPEIRTLMKQSAMEAGFGTESNVFGESEPTAAIYASLAFHLEELQRERILIRNQPIHVMMLDMGAGTSDIAIFKFKVNNDNKPVIDELITYPTIDNVYLCGGREIDRMLADHLCNYIKSLAGNQAPDAFIKSVRDGTEVWKETVLSGDLRENKTAGFPAHLSTFLSFFPQHRPFENIGRRQFELLTQSHWIQLRSLLADAIVEAKKKLTGFRGAEDIDLIVLTGGHSQWYGVKDFLLGENFAALEPLPFTKIRQQRQRFIHEARPQETVAHGLVFKDLPFDVKHTMGNSLWIQFEIDGQRSKLFESVPLNDVLPIPNEKNNGLLEWEITIKSTSITTKTVTVICHCYYGRSREEAIHKKHESVFAINDFVSAAIGGLFRGAFAAIGEAWNVVRLRWDEVGEATKSCFEETYTIKISTATRIDEDGTGEIACTLGSNWNSAAPFTIQL